MICMICIIKYRIEYYRLCHDMLGSSSHLPMTPRSASPLPGHIPSDTADPGERVSPFGSFGRSQ